MCGTHCQHETARSTYLQPVLYYCNLFNNQECFRTSYTFPPSHPPPMERTHLHNIDAWHYKTRRHRVCSFPELARCGMICILKYFFLRCDTSKSVSTRPSKAVVAHVHGQRPSTGLCACLPP